LTVSATPDFRARGASVLFDHLEPRSRHMSQQSKKKIINQRGQGMTEYIIIVSLIAIASIGVTTLFGNNIRALVGEAADALAGDDNIANRATHVTDQQTKKSMKTFATNNGLTN
jgi:Flp pilus assembly pilin Flp